MNKTYAVIFNSYVENFVTSDLPIEEILKLPERVLVEVSENHEMGAGFTYDGENFHRPPDFNSNLGNIDPNVALAEIINKIDEDKRRELLIQLLQESTTS
jgi:hypothetical protein